MVSAARFVNICARSAPSAWTSKTSSFKGSRSISFIYINDAAARAAELLAGRVDLVLGVDPAFAGSLTQTGFVIETCEKLTIAHTPNVSGGCTSSGVRYKDFVKQ